MEQAKRKEDEQQLHAVRFAAGVAVLMACLERAAVVSFFEQWRVWVFLALNLLLLAILFSSTCTTSSSSGSNEVIISSSEEENSANDVEVDGEENKSLKQCSNLEPAKSNEENAKILKCESRREEIVRKDGVDEKEKEDEDEGKPSGLSKDELNEKVEAFIAMFRQQYLVSDHSRVTKRSRRPEAVMVGGCHFVPSRISV